MTVTADDLDTAVASVVSALRPATSQDWSAQAGTLDWDCWHTAEHIGDVRLSAACRRRKMYAASMMPSSTPVPACPRARPTE